MEKGRREKKENKKAAMGRSKKIRAGQMKYPKKCPNCNTSSIRKNDNFGMKCNKCGFVNKRNPNEPKFFRAGL